MLVDHKSEPIVDYSKLSLLAASWADSVISDVRLGQWEIHITDFKTSSNNLF